MNTSNIDKDKLLEELNHEKAVLMTPVIVYISILMVVGLVGNTMVCVFYGFKTRQTSNTTFIVALAIFDMIVCGLSMPIEIVDLSLFYMFTNSGACRIMRFINHFAAIGSVAVLLAIAIDRFRHICRPFKKQLNARDAKIGSLVAVGLSVLFSWPALVVYDSISVDVKNHLGITIKGNDCTTIREKSYALYQWIFNGMYLFLFLSSTVVLIVLYSLIGRMLIRHNENRQRYSMAGPTPANSARPGTCSSMDYLTETSIVVNDITMETASEQARATSAETHNDLHRDVADASLEHRTHNNTGSNKPERTKARAEPDKLEISKKSAKSPDVSKRRSVSTLDIKTVKYTTIMFVITVVFIVSFLPYLALVIWRIFVGGYEVDVLSDGELVMFQIGLRSYMLNSTLNPLTYGFFNPKFKTFFYATLCPCFSKSKGEISISSSSGGE